MSLPTWISKQLSDCTLKWVQSVFVVLPDPPNRLSAFSLFFALIVSLSGCCTKPPNPITTALYNSQVLRTVPFLPHPPAFHVKSADQPYNKIGTPLVTEKDGFPLVMVKSTTPTMYAEQATFSTQKGTYTNHIFRIHFPRVPFDWCNLHITAGNNPGLLIIYTLDRADRLVLITTVHTCGCFLAFIPTEDLAEEFYPPDWPQETQSVYGHTLPAILGSQHSTAQIPYYFTLESGTHRISDISQKISNDPNLVLAPIMEIQPMEDLYRLPYKDKNISFFEEKGRREGYVKNNSKILERLLISWWAFDWYVGEDKAYGKNDSSTTPFYTSLKFWQRSNSDMKNFPKFLAYWGWGL